MCNLFFFLLYYNYNGGIYMCGIIGYIGKNKAINVLINGLEKMEYRGYDSSGVCLYSKE